MTCVFIHLPTFTDDCRRLRWTDDDLRELESRIAEHPEIGTVIAGTGGLRKIRFAPPSSRQGKRGSNRVCYAWFGKGRRVYLVTAYAKSAKANLNEAEVAVVRRLLESIAELERAS